MKLVRIAAVIAIGLLVAAGFVVSSRQAPPVDVARDYCVGKGFPAQDLALLGYRGSNGLFANSQTVEFQMSGANPAKRLVVDLNQAVYFLPWRVAEFREELQK